MKKMKTMLGFFLSLVFAFSLVISTPITANAADRYYTVSFALGNNKDASFNIANVEALISGKGIAKDKCTLNAKKITLKSKTTDSITITQDEIKSVIDITGDEFRFDGLKVSGADKTFAGDVVLNKDETYIVAFAIKSIISYNVSYVDTKGHAVATPVTLYAAKGEKIKVPAEHVDGYEPEKEYIEEVLSEEGQEFKFVYKEPTEVIHTTTKTETRTQYVNGGTTYTYDYQYVDGGTEVTESTTNNPTVVTNRSEHRDNGTTGSNSSTTTTVERNGNAGGAADGANASDGANGTNGTGNGSNTTTIGDGDTPLAGGKEEGTTIPEGETPKAGEKEHFVRTMMVTLFILILIVITTLVIVHVTNVKRQQTIENIEKNEHKPKRF